MGSQATIRPTLPLRCACSSIPMGIAEPASQPPHSGITVQTASYGSARSYRSCPPVSTRCPRGRVRSLGEHERALGDRSGGRSSCGSSRALTGPASRPIFARRATPRLPANSGRFNGYIKHASQLKKPSASGRHRGMFSCNRDCVIVQADRRLSGAGRPGIQGSWRPLAHAVKTNRVPV